MEMTDFNILGYVSISFLSFLLLLLVLRLFYKLLRRTVTSFRSALAGDANSYLIGGLAFVTGYSVDPSFPNWLLRFFFKFVDILFVAIPRELGQVSLQSITICKHGRFECLPDSSRNLLELATRFTAQIIASLDLFGFPALGAAYFVTLTSLAIIALRVVTQQTELPAQGYANRFLRWMRNGGDPRRARNISSLLMMLAGGYLAIASIISIAPLEEGPAIVDSERLKVQLDKLLKTEADLDLRFEKLIIPTEFNLPLPPNASDQVKSSARSFEFQLKEFQTQWANLRDGFVQKQSENRELALSRFVDENLGRRGQRETNAHAANLTAWFSNWSAESQQRLSQCKENLGRTKLYTVYLADRISVTGDSGDALLEISNSLNSMSEQTHQICAATFESPPPNRPLFGSNMGVFSALTFGLIGIESPWLAIVCGMIGVGLVGTVLSSVTREGEAKQQASLVNEAARSMGGSFIVFLAIYGGILIFTTGAKPNPYLVLFACLAGAVFSDEVWAWVRGRFERQRQESDQNSGEKHDAPPAAQKAQASTAESAKVAVPKAKPMKSAGAPRTRSRRTLLDSE
jgi:hypothetical protein